MTVDRTKPLHCYVPKGERRRYVARAKKLKKSMSAHIRELLKADLERGDD